MTLRFPPAVDKEIFLSQYWQRQPLLLPGALTGKLPAMTPAELAGLACTDDAEARLLQSDGPAEQWQLRHGPFDDDDFAGLPDSHWTLLVQDVDKFVPAVADLLGHFSFIPSWRIDDVMISYATAGGTVGPHVDQYDVFLIQGMGCRVWETGQARGGTIPDLPVRVAKQFDVQQRWELKTGDALYLPPGLAHHGYSNEESMTISVGFRAPSIAELLLSRAAHQAEKTSGRYSDKDLGLDEAADGLVSDAAIQRALGSLGAQTDALDDAAVWFGQLVTESKPWLQPPPLEEPQSLPAFARSLDDGKCLQKHPGARMAYSRRPEHGLLFVDGTAWPLDARNAWLAPALCRGDSVPGPGANPEVRELLYQLYCEGKLYWNDDE